MTYQPGADMITNTSDESGISVNRPESVSENDDIEEQSAEYKETALSGRRKRNEQREEDEREYGEESDEER